jgi:hypothetical protein
MNCMSKLLDLIILTTLSNSENFGSIDYAIDPSVTQFASP